MLQVLQAVTTLVHSLSAAARERDQVVPGQALAVPQLAVPPVAVLAPVAIAGEEECVGDLAAEAAGNVHELDQADDRRFGQYESFASDDVVASASTISALPSITRRSARRTGTMVSGSNEAFNARHRTLLLRGEDRGVDTRTRRHRPDQAAPSS